MRILQVCSADALGGGEYHVADLCRALSERGHELHLAARRGSALGLLLAEEPVEVHELPLRNATDVASSLELARLIRRLKIDVIHGHVARDYPVCGLAARLSRAALFLTRHHFRPFPRSRLYQWAIDPARALIAVSSAVSETLSIAFPKLADRIVIIPNWIDGDRAGVLPREEARQQLGLTRPLTVAVIGQISRIKQQHVFLEACARLLSSGRSDINVLLAGEAARGDETYVAEIRKLIRETGISDVAIMAGFVPSFSRYLSAVDLVVVPSANEGFSLVVLESMAAGVAVIATNRGGPAEIIQNGVTGVLVPPGDVGALERAMSSLLTDHDLRLNLGLSAKESARMRFARENLVGRIEALYRGRGIS